MREVAEFETMYILMRIEYEIYDDYPVQGASSASIFHREELDRCDDIKTAKKKLASQVKVFKRSDARDYHGFCRTDAAHVPKGHEFYNHRLSRNERLCIIPETKEIARHKVLAATG